MIIIDYVILRSNNGNKKLNLKKASRMILLEIWFSRNLLVLMVGIIWNHKGRVFRKDVFG